MHIQLFRNAKNKTATLLLLTLVVTMELMGISLVYPLIFLIFDLPSNQIPFIDKLVEGLGAAGFVASKTSFIILIIILLFSKALFALSYRYFSTISVLSYERDLRKRVFFSLFEKKETQKDHISRVQNALITQTTNASSALQNQFNLIQIIVMSVALLGLGISLSPGLLLIAITVGVAVYFSLSFTLKLARKYGTQLAAENQEYVKQITEITNAHEYLKATGGYLKLFRMLKEKIQNIYSLSMKFTIFNRGTQIFSEPIVIASLTIVIYFGVVVFEFNLGLVMIVYVVLTKLYFQVMGGIGLAQAYSRDLVSVQYCNELLSGVNPKPLEKWTAPRERLEGSIDLTDVSVTTEGKRIFQGVTMTFPARQITVIEGKTGAGKTTLLNALIGLQPLSGGEISVGGIKVGSLDSKWFRSQIGLVTQDPVIFSMTVGENLRLRNSAVSDWILEGFLDRFDLQSIFPDRMVNLSSLIYNGGALLSGGEKQRLALIRELAASPAILLLDEVTSALDSRTTEVVLDELISLKEKTTIVMISHEPAVIQYADRIYSFNADRVKRVK
jgi:ABC-type bacteriocin/lantibiotic exporter with double-glycine peptidase domain